MLSFIPTLYILFLFVMTYLIMNYNVQCTSHLSSPCKTIFDYFTKLNNKIADNNSIIHALAGIIYETFTLIKGSDVYHVNGSVASIVLYYMTQQ